MNKKKKKVLLAGGLVVLFMAAVVLAPYGELHDPTAVNMTLAKQAPSALYPFGTDAYGRCVYSRVLDGARISVFASLILVVSTGVFGSLVGLISGFFAGKVDVICMRIVDTLLAFPDLILAIVVAGIMGGGMINAMIALFITGWTSYARLARSQTFAVKRKEYISAARLSGMGNFQIVFKHILPNIAAPLFMNATVKVGSMMIGLAGLSFLGIGVSEPQAEWGSMINQATSLLQIAPWTLWAPACAIVVSVVIFNLFGDVVRDYLDPKQQMRK